jgi:threonylcarbamoyladenosine tRNA methylthiotransferase MtaB
MPGKINSNTIRDRTKRLLALGRQCTAGFKRQFKGQTLEVLFEEKEGGTWVGYTDNYIRVAIESKESLDNRIVEVRL